ncbi:MAG TPA: hypothetical protein VFP12_13440 [Allosphingosinicella sp.]|nr:hypothetical protein [Allosphingosinicella sp.]
MTANRLVLALAAALATSACATVQEHVDAYKGNVPDLSEKDVAAFVAARENVVGQLKTLSGTDPRQDGDDWRPVVDAGILYADVRCDRYMNALFWFARARESSSREIGFAGSASSAAMALLNAGKDLIGLAPLGFTFLDQTINNIGRGLLFDLSPSIVRSLVEKQQTAYLKGLNGTEFRTKSGALNAIQGYTAICLPPSIETEVSRAVEASEYRPVDYSGAKEPPRDSPGEAADAVRAPAAGAQPESPPPSQPPRPDSTPILGRAPGG